MKKALFICLLSFAVCLGKPANDPGSQAVPSTAAPVPDAKANQTAPIHEAPAGVNITTPSKPDSINKTSTEAVPATTTIAPKHPTVAPSAIPDKKNDKAANVVPIQDKPTSTVNPTHATEKAGTTPKPEVTTKPTSTTVEPHKAEDKPSLQKRGFDGASFIGGIILTLGLLAIGFMGFKYYKTQTERNYHTL